MERKGERQVGREAGRGLRQGERQAGRGGKGGVDGRERRAGVWRGSQ